MPLTCRDVHEPTFESAFCPQPAGHAGRQPVDSRLTSLAQLLSFGAAGLALAWGSGTPWPRAAALTVTIAILGIAFYLTTVSTAVRAADHIAQIERRVDALARQNHGADADVLTWEILQQARHRSTRSDFVYGWLRRRTRPAPVD